MMLAKILACFSALRTSKDLHTIAVQAEVTSRETTATASSRPLEFIFDHRSSLDPLRPADGWLVLKG